jgi:hypothetical protein
LGEGLSGYFTYSNKISLPLTTILPFLTSYDIAAPLMPKAFNLSFNILPGSGLGVTIKFVIFSPFESIMNGVILIS